MKPHLVPCAFAIAFFLTQPATADQAVKFMLKGDTQTVLPIGFNNSSVLALTQNGYMREYRPKEMKNPKVIPTFRPYTQSQVRGELLREFGKSFDVTGTGNYLVVHPRGAKDLWANRFEDLYRSMVHFFRTRGYPMGKPKFPLVSVVFYSQAQYLDYNRKVLRSNASGSLGVYMPVTNRIYLYDATQGRGEGTPQWDLNLATVMHEAAHQTAFNTGIHVRGAETPYWVAEGLGGLFEARGIYNSFKHRKKEDRINYIRFEAFQKDVNAEVSNYIPRVIANDDLFKRDPGRAYATAWALTYYLSERKPREYIRYLKIVAEKKPLTRYTPSERTRDFAKVFGKDLDSIAVQVKRYMDAMPKNPASSRR